MKTFLHGRALGWWMMTPGGAFYFNTNRAAQSMNGFTGFYFSFITLSTVGYADITAISIDGSRRSKR